MDAESNSTLDKVKGHQIEKVNELDEKNKQFQMYNQNLRCELVQERENSQKTRGTNTIPADLEDDNHTKEDQQDLSSDSVPDNNMEPVTFVTNVLVMDKIFGYLDVKDLKECRLICKDWNEAISSILSKRNNGNGLGVNLELQVLYASKLKIGGGNVKERGMEEAREIHSIVEAAPPNWFRMVNLDDKSWTTDAFKSVFQDFGSRLKVIKVTSLDIHIQTLRSILLDWCPNLEDLILNSIELENDLKLEVSRPLKLIRLSFNLNIIYNYMMRKKVANVLFVIIKNSPNLKKLESFGSSTTVPKQLFSELENYPQIMNRMEEIFLRSAPSELMHHGDMQDPLEALSNIQFESKLKNLTLTEIKPGQSMVLNQLLNLTNESLEKLTVISDNEVPTSVEMPNFQLKQMNRLREFRYHTDRKGLINSIDVLVKKMPNLKIFVLGFESISYSSRCFYKNDFIDKIFSNCEELMGNPHQNLNQLHLFGDIYNPRDTFDVINVGFPNLKKLVLGIRCHKNQNNAEEDDLLPDFSSFEHHSESTHKIGTILSYLQKLPNLRYLTMRVIYGANLYFDEDEELFISKVPKLQRLTLVGYMINRDQAKKLGELLDQRGVFLDIKEHQHHQQQQLLEESEWY